MSRFCAILISLTAFQRACALGQGEYELVAHLRQKSLPELERRFWDVADPDSKEYLQHMSLEQLASTIGATNAEVTETRNWLLSLGAIPSSIAVSALRDTVAATFPPAASSIRNVFQAEGRPSAVEFTVRRDPNSPALPRPRHNTLGATESYSIGNIKEAYGIPASLQASNPKTLQMVWGPGTFGYSTSDLKRHKDTQCPLLNMDKIKFDTQNHGKNGGDNFGEGNLDVQMITSFGLNVETVVSNTNTSASTEEGTGFGQALLDFITELSSRTTVPQVLSMSLGSLSAASCDLLCTEAAKKGHTLEKCKAYLQTQRQVCMFISQAQQNRINTAFQVLGLRGVSIFGSSGDGGSHFSFGKFSGGFWTMASILNEISCEFQMPVFPTSSPYVISVGGTMWGGQSPSTPITWAGYGGGSGGGFSWEFDMPDHQKSTIAAYLANTSGLPPASSFNAKGRAYPDIAAIGVSGTSQSCPIMAGIFSMIMDARLNAGLPPLGYVAPRIYKLAAQFRGEVFESVPKGNSKTSCDNGFPSVANGWDANTGLGRPLWAGMTKRLASDATIAKKAVANIVV